MSDSDGKNPSRVAGGLKATINNPNQSDNVKQDAKQRLDGMDSEDIAPQSQRDEPSEADTISGNQAGGYKATLKNPNVSEEAKEKARNILSSTQQDYVTDVNN